MIRALFSSMLIIGVLFVGGTASATPPLRLSSHVFVERQIVRADGTKTFVLEAPKLVTPGDHLVFVVKYRNVGSATASKFVITNPLPTAVAFNGTTDGLELVSVDGGRNWGSLAALRVGRADGTFRVAQRSDVTHIKWNLIQPLTAGAEGKLIFRGIVK